MRARKEQLKDLKTKYVRFAQAGSFYFGGSGMTSQQIIGADLTAFLAAVSAGIAVPVGGAEQDSPAVVRSIFTGSFLVAGVTGQFVVTLISDTGVSSAHTVTLGPADAVTLGGSSVVTPSRAVWRINFTIDPTMATVVAASVDGNLVLTSPDVGDVAGITLAEVTPGILANLGFSAGTFHGTTAPRRGLVTVSPDGLGGTVQIKNLDYTPSEPAVTSAVHTYGYRYVPNVYPGQPAYVRLRDEPASGGLRAEFYRTAPLFPRIVTGAVAPPAAVAPYLSNFSSLVAPDNIGVTVIYDGSPTGGAAFSVSFTTISTALDVVNAFNAAYGAYTLATFGVDSRRAAVRARSKEPYTLSLADDSFYISLNGGVKARVNLPSYAYPNVYLTSLINTALTTAGYSLVTDGHAVASNGYLVIESLVLETGSVTIWPGDTPGTYTVPGTGDGAWMATLDRLGIVPGTYAGSTVASLLNGDEVAFTSPTAGSGAQISLYGNPATLQKLGLGDGVIATTPVVSVTQGASRTSVPRAQALVPEMLEFSEEPDDYDVQVQGFEADGKPPQASALDGVRNALLNSVFGVDGRIDPSLLPTILESLDLNRLRLGDRLTDSAANQRLPRTEVSHTSAYGPVLVWQGSTTSGVISEIVRVYLHSGCVWITSNAAYVGTQWVRDYAAPSAIMEWDSGRVAFGSYSAAAASPWNHVGPATPYWDRNVKVNPYGIVGISPDIVGFGAELLRLGDQLIDTDAKALVARIKEESPSAASPRSVLLFEQLPSVGGGVRFYVTTSLASVKLEVATNAWWNGTVWTKDANGTASTMLELGVGGLGGLNVYEHIAADDTPGVPAAFWGSVPSAGLGETGSPGVALLNYFKGTTWALGQLRVGDDLRDALDATTQRINVDRAAPDTGGYRTLIFQSGTTTGSAPGPSTVYGPPLRIYLEANAYPSGSNSFLFTSNAVWVPGSGLWSADYTVLDAFAWTMSTGTSSGARHLGLLKKKLGMTTWSDNSWDVIDFLNVSDDAYRGFNTQDGRFQVLAPTAAAFGSNPGPTDSVVLNAVYAKTMVKSWGSARYGGLGVSTPYDGFNFASITQDGVDPAASWISSYVVPVAAPPNHPTVLTTVMSLSGIADVPRSVVYTSLNTGFTHYLIDSGGAIHTSASAVIVNHLTFNTQP